MNKIALYTSIGIVIGFLGAGIGFVTYLKLKSTTQTTQVRTISKQTSDTQSQTNKLNSADENTDHNSTTVAASSSSPKRDPLTTVNFIGNDGNSVTIPLVGLTATYGIDNGHPSILPNHPISNIQFTIPNNQVDQLAAYWVNEGNGKGRMFLGPKGWNPVQIGIGADGSEGFTLVSPSDPNQKFSIMNDGACQGCAVDDIYAFFPKARNQIQSDLVVEKNTANLANPVEIDDHTVAFSLQPPTSELDGNGVAHWENGDILSFSKAEITLSKDKHALETTILNFYLKDTMGRLY